MKARLHKALDGDLDPDDLSQDELAELRETESVIEAVLRAVPNDRFPDLAPAVLQRIQDRQTSHVVGVGQNAIARRTLTEWLWRPRAISFAWRPAYAFAAAVMLAVLVVADYLQPNRSALQGTQQVFTQFLLKAPDAKNVALAGDFTDWQPAFPLTRSEPGVWTVVVPLDPGIHSYSFVVDGERWVPDPMAPAVDDGFGGRNSRVAVLTPDEGGR